MIKKIIQITLLSDRRLSGMAYTPGKYGTYSKIRFGNAVLKRTEIESVMGCTTSGMLMNG